MRVDKNFLKNPDPIADYVVQTKNTGTDSETESIGQD